MRAAINVQMIVELPNDFNEKNALSLISDEFQDFLSVGLTSDDYLDDIPEIIINSIKVRSFRKLAPLALNQICAQK